MADMMHQERVCDVKWGTLTLIGFLSLIFGIIILFYPGITAGVIVMLFGVLVIILAVLALITALLETGGRSTLLLLGAILGFIVGVGALVSPIVIGSFLVIIIGIVLIGIAYVLGFWPQYQKARESRRQLAQPPAASAGNRGPASDA